MSSSSSKKNFFCTNCESGWVRKIDFDNHFTLNKVRSSSGGSGGPLVSNPCYLNKKRQYGSTLAEARSLKKVRTLSFFPSGSNFDMPSTSQSESEQPYFRLEAPDRPLEFVSQNFTTDQSPARNESAKSSNQTSDSGSIMSVLKSMDLKLDTICKNTASGSSKSQGTLSDHAQYIAAIKKVLSVDEELYDKCVKDVSSEKTNSVKQILDNPIVKNVFEVVQDGDGVYRLVCLGCQKYSNNYRGGFKLDDGPDYSVYSSGFKQPMARWFSNLKANLTNHIVASPHHIAVKTLLQEWGGSSPKKNQKKPKKT